MLFVGSFQHAPNVDAVRHLVESLWPHIRRVEPDATLTVAGAHMTAEVESLGRPGIEIVGWVPDLEPLYQQSRVFVAPLRYGAGMKGKVAESMIHGLPVVTTSVGAEGMSARPGHDLLVADDPNDFAAAVTRLMSDDALWHQLARNGAALIQSKFGPGAARVRLQEMLEVLVDSAPRR
jgi:glycosyltransferase involved in cell wall biosynthesis